MRMALRFLLWQLGHGDQHFVLKLQQTKAAVQVATGAGFNIEDWEDEDDCCDNLCAL